MITAKKAVKSACTRYVINQQLEQNNNLPESAKIRITQRQPVICNGQVQKICQRAMQRRSQDTQGAPAITPQITYTLGGDR